MEKSLWLTHLSDPSLLPSSCFGCGIMKWTNRLLYGLAFATLIDFVLFASYFFYKIRNIDPFVVPLEEIFSLQYHNGSQYLFRSPNLYENSQHPALNQNKKRIAIVMPFSLEQYSKGSIEDAIEYWISSSSSIQPCNVDKQAILNYSATLVLYFDQNIDMNHKDVQLLKYRIINMWKYIPSNIQKCFPGGIKFINANLNADNMVLSNTAKQSLDCILFHKLFYLLNGHYDYFFYYEPENVIPIQNHWLDQIIRETEDVPCQTFFQKGSIPRCHQQRSHNSTIQDIPHNYQFNDSIFKRLYINRNALYCLSNSRAFGKYLDATKQLCQNLRTNIDYFEQQMYELLLVDHIHRNITDMFQFCGFIQNRCDDIIHINPQFKNENPDTFLVYSRSLYATKQQQKIFENYMRILNRYPDPRRNHFERHLSQFYQNMGEVNEFKLVQDLCSSDEYIDHFINKGRSSSICDEYCSTWSIPNLGACKFVIKDLEQKSKVPPPNIKYVWNIDNDMTFFKCNAGIMKDQLDMNIHHQHTSTVMNRALQNVTSISHQESLYLLKKIKDFLSKADPTVKRADMFICSNPKDCNYFEGFNKPMILILNPRQFYNAYRGTIPWSIDQANQKSEMIWKKYVHQTVEFSKNKKNKIISTDMFSFQYMKQILNIDSIYLPHWCGPNEQIGTKYHSKRFEILITAPTIYDDHPMNLHDEGVWNNPLLKSLRADVNTYLSRFDYIHDISFQTVKEAYPKSDPKDISQHRAVVFLPYISYLPQFIEYYRWNVPLFVPSINLLTEWSRVYETPVDFPFMHFNTTVSEKWIQYLEFYMMPHVQYFDSWNDLLYKIQQCDFEKIHNDMRTFNSKTSRELVSMWNEILRTTQ